ncbi:hypothetical protein NL492_26325, partial [Klebsiella pneumoniae]|nr:hypothetical protein [Klebsiella pneumoniae]
KLIFSTAVTAIIFGNVYADYKSDCLNELKEEGGYNLDDNRIGAFKHTIDYNISNRHTNQYKISKEYVFNCCIYHFVIVNNLEVPIIWCLKYYS